MVNFCQFALLFISNCGNKTILSTAFLKHETSDYSSTCVVKFISECYQSFLFDCSDNYFVNLSGIVCQILFMLLTDFMFGII